MYTTITHVSGSYGKFANVNQNTLTVTSCYMVNSDISVKIYLTKVCVCVCVFVLLLKIQKTYLNLLYL